MPPRPRLPRALLLLAAAWLAPTAPAGAFDLEDVAKQAQAIAATSFRDPRGEVPGWLLEIGYDQWRDIRFRPDQSLWRAEELPFQVQLFHPGLYFDRSVTVNLIEGATVQPLPFSATFFHYGKNDFVAKIPKDIGWAGVRVHANFKKPEYFDEVIVFLGASYFRAVGRDNVFTLRLPRDER